MPLTAAEQTCESMGQMFPEGAAKFNWFFGGRKSVFHHAQKPRRERGRARQPACSSPATGWCWSGFQSARGRSPATTSRRRNRRGVRKPPLDNTEPVSCCGICTVSVALTTTGRTNKALRPPQGKQICAAPRFVAEATFQFQQRSRIVLCHHAKHCSLGVESRK